MGPLDLRPPGDLSEEFQRVSGMKSYRWFPLTQASPTFRQVQHLTTPGSTQRRPTAGQSLVLSLFNFTEVRSATRYVSSQWHDLRANSLG